MQKQRIMQISIIILRIISLLILLVGALAAVLAFQSNSLEKKERIENERSSEILEVISLLQHTYNERNPENIGILEEKIIKRQIPTILGTSPNEIIKDMDTIRKLFIWDWTYWGEVDFNFENALIQENINSVEIISYGRVKSKAYRINIPLRVYIILEEEDDILKISMMSFNYALIIENLFVSILLIITSMIIFIVSSILEKNIIIEKAKK